VPAQDLNTALMNIPAMDTFEHVTFGAARGG
jgi:hypothetical protein